MKKNFKKLMSLVLCVVLVLATCLTTGCSKKDSNNEPSSTPAVETTSTPEASTEAPTAEVTETPEVTEAPTEEITEAPEVTEAPTEEITEAPEVTDAPTEEITEAPVEDGTDDTNFDTNDDVEIIEVGEGETNFTFVCVDKDKNMTVFSVNTNQITVGSALLELGLIAGEESEYGLYVKEVNGIVADWDIDGTYWAFYIDGEYAMTGVDSTDVVAGAEYTFVVE